MLFIIKTVSGDDNMKDVYFRRQIEEKLEKWHNTSDKLVLEIKGGRQIGKTTTILQKKLIRM